MNKPKRHHWWPQVQSRSWTGDDQLVYVTKKDGTYFRTSPNNIAVESELYTRFPHEGPKDVGIEEWFSKEIDGPASEIIGFLSELSGVRRFAFSGDREKAATL